MRQAPPTGPPPTAGRRRGCFTEARWGLGTCRKNMQGICPWSHDEDDVLHTKLHDPKFKAFGPVDSIMPTEITPAGKGKGKGKLEEVHKIYESMTVGKGNEFYKTKGADSECIMVKTRMNRRMLAMNSDYIWIPINPAVGDKTAAAAAELMMMTWSEDYEDEDFGHMMVEGKRMLKESKVWSEYELPMSDAEKAILEKKKAKEAKAKEIAELKQTQVNMAQQTAAMQQAMERMLEKLDADKAERDEELRVRKRARQHNNNELGAVIGNIQQQMEQQNMALGQVAFQQQQQQNQLNAAAQVGAADQLPAEDAQNPAEN